MDTKGGSANVLNLLRERERERERERQRERERERERERDLIQDFQITVQTSLVHVWADNDT